MGMPKFPERDQSPSVREVVLQLIESVAVEELAIAHILNAEGEKLQELIKKYACLDVSTGDLCKISRNTNTLVSSLIVKEFVLLNKLNSALEIFDTLEKETIKEVEVCCRNYRKSE